MSAFTFKNVVVPMKCDIKDIAASIRRRELFIFGGAGISMARPSELPSFQDLQNEVIWALLGELESALRNTYEPVYTQIKAKIVSSDLAARFLRVPPEYVFQLCKESITVAVGPEKHYELQALSTFSDAAVNNNHLILARLLTGGHVPVVFTTNFDLLIDSACLQLGTTVRRRWKREQFTDVRSSEAGLYKLHGSIDDPESVAVSLDEIGKRAATDKLRALRHFLEHYDALFLGYRGADIDIFSCLATTDSKRILWNDRSEDCVLPKVQRLLHKKNGAVITGDLCNLLREVSRHLNLPAVPETDREPNDTPGALSAALGEWASNIDAYSKILIGGRLWEFVGDSTNAVKFFRFGAELARDQDKKAIHSVFLTDLAGVYYKVGKYREAKGCCTEALSNAESLPQQLRLYHYIDFLQLLALMESRQDIKSAFVLLVRSLKYQEQLESIDETTKHKKGSILLNAGKMLQEGGIFDEAIECYKSALGVCDEVGDVRGRAKVLANIGSILLQQGNVDECMHWYNEAEYLFTEIGVIIESCGLEE